MCAVWIPIYWPTASLTTTLMYSCPHSEPSGLFDGAAESVWDVRNWHNLSPPAPLPRWDYNYRTAATPMDATVSVRHDAVTTGEHYRYAAPYRDAGDDASPGRKPNPGVLCAHPSRAGAE